MSRMGEREGESVNVRVYKMKTKLSLERMPTSEVISFAQIPLIPYDSIKASYSTKSPPHPSQ